MTFEVILLALTAGFIAGILGALVTVDIKTEKIRKEVNDLVLAIENGRSQTKTNKTKTDTEINALTIALQRLIEQQKRDRGAIWESLNGLWNDYDERHKTEPAAEPVKKEPKPKKTAKAKEPKANEK